jgi:glucose/arabinose dehydrogenase
VAATPRLVPYLGHTDAMRIRAVVGLIIALALLSGCGSPAPTPPSDTPALHVETIARGLDHPWDLGFLPDGSMLVTERPGRLQLVRGSAKTQVRADLSDVFAQGESGLMSLLVHPDFAASRQFSTCQSHTENGRPVDIRVKTWRLSDDDTTASPLKDPLVAGLPLNPTGRHSGCRLALGPAGELLITTGDTANPSVSQDLSSLGGKTLHAGLATGKPLAGAPFPEHPYVWTYGHRNLQGIEVRPGTTQVFTAEHGPDVDDEVNVEIAGGNYGWDPGKGGTQQTYDESVPMTDTKRFPDAVRAVWSSGDPTEAISGAAFLSGPQWDSLDGAFVVAALKGMKLLAMTMNQAGAVTRVIVPPELSNTHGRLRSVHQGPDGALYVTTDNGSGADEVLKVTPARP